MLAWAYLGLCDIGQTSLSERSSQHIYSSQTVFLGLTTVLFCVKIVPYVDLFLCKTLPRFGDLAS